MTDLDNTLQQLKTHLSLYENEVNKLKLGRKNASINARKHLMTIRNDASLLRTKIMAFVKNLPTRTAKKKDDIVPDETSDIPPPPTLERSDSVHIGTVPVKKKKVLREKKVKV